MTRLEKQRPIAGEVLVDQFMLPAQESMHRLARNLGVPLGHLLGVVSGRTPITEPLAMKLALHYGPTVRFWMRLQNGQDSQAA